MKDLRGFQIVLPDFYNERFFDPQCKIITSNPHEDYGITARIWYFSKCVGKFSYKESLFDKIKLRFDYTDFSIEVDNRVFINFRYFLRSNIESLEFKEIK